MNFVEAWCLDDASEDVWISEFLRYGFMLIQLWLPCFALWAIGCPAELCRPVPETIGFGDFACSEYLVDSTDNGS